MKEVIECCAYLPGWEGKKNEKEKAWPEELLGLARPDGRKRFRRADGDVRRLIRRNGLESSEGQTPPEIRANGGGLTSSDSG